MIPVDRRPAILNFLPEDKRVLPVLITLLVVQVIACVGGGGGTTSEATPTPTLPPVATVPPETTPTGMNAVNQIMDAGGNVDEDKMPGFIATSTPDPVSP